MSACPNSLRINVLLIIHSVYVFQSVMQRAITSHMCPPLGFSIPQIRQHGPNNPSFPSPLPNMFSASIVTGRYESRCALSKGVGIDVQEHLYRPEPI
jgi:hypothetical protein